MENLVVTEFRRAVQFKRNKGNKVQWKERKYSGICNVLMGSILFKFCDKEILCRSNEALFIPEGASYTLEYLENSHAILFDFKTLEVHNDVEKIKDVNLHKNFKVIRNYFVVGNKVKFHHMCVELYKILAMFSDEGVKNKNTKTVRAAERIIADNLGNSDFVCRNIAEQLKISEVYLGRLFKEERGMPPRKFLIKVRMEEAKSLLEEQFSVTKVSRMVGYKDVFQFSKAYKKFYGYSPKFSKDNYADELSPLE